MGLRKKFLIIPLLLLALLSLKPAPLAAHIIDADSPTCAISFVPVSPQTDSDTIQITVTADGALSGISSIILNSNGSFLSTSTTSPLIYSNWTPDADSYNLTASVINGSGNTISTTTPCFVGYTYIVNPAVGAWIQAVGDVHSNTGINTPGGP